MGVKGKYESVVCRRTVQKLYFPRLNSYSLNKYYTELFQSNIIIKLFLLFLFIALQTTFKTRALSNLLQNIDHHIVENNFNLIQSGSLIFENNQMHYKNQTFQKKTKNSYQQCSDLQYNCQQQQAQIQNHLIKVFRPLDLKRHLLKLQAKIQMQILSSFLTIKKIKSSSQKDLIQKKQSFAKAFYLNHKINKLQNAFHNKQKSFICFSQNRLSKRSLQLEKARIVSVILLSNWSTKYIQICQRLRLRFKYDKRILLNNQTKQVKEMLKNKNQKMVIQNGFRIIEIVFLLREMSLLKVFLDKLQINSTKNRHSYQNLKLGMQKIKDCYQRQLRVSFYKINEFTIENSRDNPQIFTNFLKHACFLARQHTIQNEGSRQVNVQKNLYALKSILRKNKLSNKQLQVYAFRGWRLANAKFKVQISHQINNLKRIKQRLEDKLN